MIRVSLHNKEFDHQALLNQLPKLVHPRKRITGLLRRKEIIRVKQGLYISGDDYRQRTFSPEILANLIYGPSYISSEHALHYHGLLSTVIEPLTSVTCGRSRTFDTPVGRFVYRMINMDAFRTGMDRFQIDGSRSFLMAIPEKALADKIVMDHKNGISTQWELYEYLVNELCIEPAALQRLNISRLMDIADRYRSRKVKLLARLISRMRYGGV
jgi:hypothetical protein